MNIREYNRSAWDNEVERGNEWTQPVSPELIAAARQGQWEVLLTETKPVPREWFPDLHGLAVLCLASGAGFYEDRHRNHAVAKYTPTYIATRAIKPKT